MPPDTSSTNERESPANSVSSASEPLTGPRLELFQLAERFRFPAIRISDAALIQPGEARWRVACRMLTDESVAHVFKLVQAELVAVMPTIIASDMICRHACLLDLGLESTLTHEHSPRSEHRPAAVQEVAVGRHVVLCEECRQTLRWVLFNDPKQTEIVRRGLESDFAKRLRGERTQ